MSKTRLSVVGTDFQFPANSWSICSSVSSVWSKIHMHTKTVKKLPKRYPEKKKPSTSVSVQGFFFFNKKFIHVRFGKRQIWRFQHSKLSTWTFITSRAKRTQHNVECHNRASYSNIEHPSVVVRNVMSADISVYLFIYRK